jgi:hypothetical protein
MQYVNMAIRLPYELIFYSLWSLVLLIKIINLITSESFHDDPCCLAHWQLAREYLVKLRRIHFTRDFQIVIDAVISKKLNKGSISSDSSRRDGFDIFNLESIVKMFIYCGHMLLRQTLLPITIAFGDISINVLLENGDKFTVKLSGSEYSIRYKPLKFSNDENVELDQRSYRLECDIKAKYLEFISNNHSIKVRGCHALGLDISKVFVKSGKDLSSIQTKRDISSIIITNRIVIDVFKQSVSTSTFLFLSCLLRSLNVYLAQAKESSDWSIAWDLRDIHINIHYINHIEKANKVYLMFHHSDRNREDATVMLPNTGKLVRFQ